MNRTLSALVLGLALGLAGCSSTIHVDALSPKPAKLMVASKLEVPLYIILDPAKVQDTYDVPQFGTVVGMHAFVKRDLVGVMSQYFSEVKVVSNASEAAESQYVLADVSIEQFSRDTQVIAGTAHKILVMNWNFALRPNDAEDYLFSFAGIARSEAPAKSIGEVGTRLIENSLTGLLDEWANSGAFAALREWASGSAAAGDQPGEAVE